MRLPLFVYDNYAAQFTENKTNIKKILKNYSRATVKDKAPQCSDVWLTAPSHREHIPTGRKRKSLLSLHCTSSHSSVTHPPSLLYSCQLSYLAHVCPLWPCMALPLLPSLLLTSVLLSAPLSLSIGFCCFVTLHKTTHAHQHVHTSTAHICI